MAWPFRAHPVAGIDGIIPPHPGPFHPASPTRSSQLSAQPSQAARLWLVYGQIQATRGRGTVLRYTEIESPSVRRHPGQARKVYQPTSPHTTLQL